MAGIGTGFWGIHQYGQEVDTMLAPYPTTSEINLAHKQIGSTVNELVSQLINSDEEILRPSVSQRYTLVYAQQILRSADDKAEMMKTPEYKTAFGGNTVGIFSSFFGLLSFIHSLSTMQSRNRNNQPTTTVPGLV